jgi:N-acetyl-anhydromuramyl-L-alanine amidase AmpD
VSLQIDPIHDFDGRGWFKHQPRPVRPTTVVLHATAGGTLAGAVETLRERGLGYHYLIEPDGQVWKGAPIARQIGHAGESVGPEGPSVNRYSIGVSWVNLNDGTQEISEAQLAAAEELLVLLRKGLPSLKWLTTHYAITVRPDGGYRKSDPRGVDVPKLARASGLEAWKPDWAKRFALP